MRGSLSTRRSRTRRSSAVSAATRTSRGWPSGSTSRATGCRTLERELHAVGPFVVVAGVEALDPRDGAAPPARELLLAIGVGELADPLGGEADVHPLVGLQVVAQIGDPLESRLLRLAPPLA